MEQFKRNRESVKAAQSTALKTETRGIAGKEGREDAAEAFADRAIRFVRQASKEGRLPFTLLPEHENKVCDLLYEMLVLHHMALSKANNDVLSNTIFEDKALTPTLQSARAEYVYELLSVALENVIATEGKDEVAFRLATYRDAEWMDNMLSGKVAKDVLLQSAQYSEHEIENFLSVYTHHFRLKTILSNIKKPEEAILAIAQNFFNKLSNESIRGYFHDRLEPIKIEEIIQRLTQSTRMQLAVNNISDPLKALAEVATGKRGLKYSNDTKKFNFSLKSRDKLDLV